jgi:hypothetical protein
MRVRTAAPIALAVLVAVGPAAHAAPKKKPITKKYTLTLNPAPVEVPLQETACQSTLRQPGVNLDVKEIKVSGPGKLKVTVTGFTGDWDTSLYSSTGQLLSEGDGTSFPDNMSTPAAGVDETLAYKSKKAQTLMLRVCNYVGAPSATVTYTYTYS